MAEPLADIALWTLAGYVLGSVPFGLVLTRAFGAGDIRAIGSGNIGSTNVLRTGRRDLALLTLLLDGGKGAAAVLAAASFGHGEGAPVAAGAAAFLGHIFPVWLKFAGGKGVATFLGTLLAIAWPVGFGAVLAWLATAVVSRYSSLAALAAAALAPVLALAITRDPLLSGLCVFMLVLIVIRHSGNIRRLLKGEETKIGDSQTV